MAAILAVLAPYRDELAGMVVESTFNWYWLVDGLQEAGYRVHLANTTAARIKSNDVKRQKVDRFSGAAKVARAGAEVWRLRLILMGVWRHSLRSHE